MPFVAVAALAAAGLWQADIVEHDHDHHRPVSAMLLRVEHNSTTAIIDTANATNTSATMAPASASYNSSATKIDCAKECPCGVPTIPVPDQWLEVMVTGGFKVWHIIFIIIAFLVTLVVVYCCFHRCRIPRTKQEIEADLMRSTLTDRFRDYLQELPNEQFTFMEALRKVQEMEDKLDASDILARDGAAAGARKRMGWLKLKGKQPDKQQQQQRGAGATQDDPNAAGANELIASPALLSGGAAAAAAEAADPSGADAAAPSGDVQDSQGDLKEVIATTGGEGGGTTTEGDAAAAAKREPAARRRKHNKPNLARTKGARNKLVSESAVVASTSVSPTDVAASDQPPKGSRAISTVNAIAEPAPSATLSPSNLLLTPADAEVPRSHRKSRERSSEHRTLKRHKHKTKQPDTQSP